MEVLINHNRPQPPVQPTAQQQASVVPPEHKGYYGKKNWVKWILIYAAVGLLLYGGVYYFVLSKQGLNPYSSKTTQYPTQAPISTSVPSPTGSQSVDTSTWKTYTDNKNIFSLKYPSTLEVTVSNTGIALSNYKRLLQLPSGVSGKDYVNIGVGIYAVDRTANFKQWIIQKTVRPLPDGTTRSSIQGDIKSYNLNGLVGYSFVSGSEESDKNIVVEDNTHAAWFTLIGYQTGSSYKDNPNAEALLDQILSTFRFSQ